MFRRRSYKLKKITLEVINKKPHLFSSEVFLKNVKLY